jgi:hypothetical protein
MGITNAWLMFVLTFAADIKGAAKAQETLKYRCSQR